MKDIEYLKQKKDVIKEFGNNHTKRSIKVLLVPIVLGMLSAGLSQVILSKNFFELLNMSQEEVQSYNFLELENCMLLLGIIISTVLYLFSLKWYVNKIYFMFRDEYRTVFISGLREDKLVKNLATYPMLVLMICAYLGMIIVPQIYLGYFDLVDFNWLALVFIVMLTYIIMRDVYRRDFCVITGLYNNDYDMSMVDGRYKLIPYLNVPENIGLPNRILRGEGKEEAVCTAFERMKELGLDKLAYVNVADMNRVQIIQVMIARAYSVAGKELKFDENMLQGLSEAERNVIDMLLYNIKNLNIKEQCLPTNVCR